MNEVFAVRRQALREGRETREAVREYLAGLSDTNLAEVVAQFESCKSRRPKKREAQMQLITARACQGDAFYSG